ncbi:MAG: nucleotidyltransferase domain-containing protein [Spirochaetaceae bacterium]|jgi:predicted nucleotidyltransferase|nr:nucleotidyltransferase domain-containing protein [Spirochaetaceae bacterium]
MMSSSRGKPEAEIRAQLAAIKDIIVKTIPVEQIYLFGSYAYGTPHDYSDLDFYVVMKDDSPYQELDAESLITDALYGRTLIPIDILVIKKTKFDYRRFAATLEREVANKGMLL